MFLKNDARAIKESQTNYRLRDEKYYFRTGITWGRITSADLSFREAELGSVFGDAGPMLFIQSKSILHYVLGFLNSKLVTELSAALNPTLNFQVDDLRKLPLKIDNSLTERVDLIVSQNVDMCREFENNSELSSSFDRSSFTLHIAEHQRNWTLQEAFAQWSKEADNRFNQLKSNEEELNRIFIDLYGLQGELTPEVADKDVSVRRADLPRDIKAFLSYFVGVTFGRYSIDTPGLAFAGGDWHPESYSTYQPNEDNLILLTDQEYFHDERDIIFRLKEFLTATFGEDHLDENVRFIADALDKKGATPEEQIRNYFLDDFYKKDHLSTYQKRPIYWELSSGKQAGFRALIYLHRYDQDTMAMVRTAYLHPLQEAYTATREQLQHFSESETNPREKNALSKRIATITKQLDELIKYDAKLQHVANSHIAIDLDDGVVVNHDKVQDGEKLLSPIK
ncbi:BREX-1 system adenine-specific DNA-methyltransferase PglX [Lacticaseibacillus mingshuiensis]|uniref:BREX-1 system adenine-specific DNA-methyltransferase PglX n=1 Tax=Lacticaseibacillus mingshuiensis TaxID=2799574 RepID=UPI001CEC7F84|nr:BREX-1 system adenine-specific DNA-methyltransferase PglX [Lacticaseibacillus mingshuiensis]